MRIAQFIAIAALLTSSLAAHNALALTIDQTTGTNSDGSAKFDDPDDKIPFPHMADDGQPTNNFQAQPVGNTGMSFGLTPSRAEPDAFQRSQENRQQ